MRNFLGAAYEMSEALEGKGGAGSSEVGILPHLSLLAPRPQLGEDMEAYVLRPAVQGPMMQCHICRDKHGVDKGMFPFYYLYLEAEAESRKVRFGNLGGKTNLLGQVVPLAVRSCLFRIQALIVTEIGPVNFNPKTYPSQN